MKVIWTVVVSCFCVCKGTDLLDEYRQTDYNVKFERAEVAWHNRSYLKNPNMCFTYYNRTQRVLNMTFLLLRDLTKDITMEMQFYKFMSNEYRYFPIRFAVNICNRYERNSFGVQQQLRNVSNIHSCPWKKGFYYLCNYVFDASKFPPFIPRGSYKGTMKLNHKSDAMMESEIFATAMDKPLKWET